MKKQRAFKFRIYPTKLQEEYFANVFGCCRFIYNKMLDDKITKYEETKESLRTYPATYKAEFD
jgi:putative transposase